MRDLYNQNEKLFKLNIVEASTTFGKVGVIHIKACVMPAQKQKREKSTFTDRLMFLSTQPWKILLLATHLISMTQRNLLEKS